jgi:hypothetical protein
LQQKKQLVTFEASTKMDDSVNNVAQAIATALNWSSTPDARQSALSFLDSVISSSFSRSLFEFIFHFSFFFSSFHLLHALDHIKFCI